MHEHWLRKQLTRAKQGAPLWVELADAVQEIVEQHAMPLVSRLRNLSSAFTMDEQDIDRKIGELGRFFAIRAVDYESKPIIFMQRLDEIHLKDTEYPVINTLWREFKGLSVTWQPLYAPIDQEKHPYGSVLITKDSAKAAAGRYGEMFLTSRGVIRLPINELMRAHDSDEMDQVISNLIAEFKVYVEPLLPLHIVFDGTELELKYTIKEADEWLRAISETIGQDVIRMIEAQERLGASDQIEACPVITLGGSIKHADFYARYDDIPLDGWTLDDNWLPFYFDDVAAVRAREMFRDSLSFTEREELAAITIRERNELLKTTFRQAAPDSVRMADRAEQLAAQLMGVMESGRMVDAGEAARLIRTELADIVRHHEAIEGVKPTLTDLQDFVAQVHRTMAHEGYTLAFDMVPMDQWILDAEKLDV